MPATTTLSLILATYSVVSAVTFLAYGWDKHRARRGGRRVPERTLQTLAVLGGWPGALLGARTFRHKLRKKRFFRTLQAIALAHVVGWAIFLVAGR